MSEAALVSNKDIYFLEVGRKEMVLPTPPSETVFVAYDNVSEIKRRKIAYEGPQLEAVAPERDGRELLWTIAISCVVMIVVVGLIIGYLIPGPITGVILPIGLALWWFLYKLADRIGYLA